jgi:hypothetical protein
MEVSMRRSVALLALFLPSMFLAHAEEKESKPLAVVLGNTITATDTLPEANWKERTAHAHSFFTMLPPMTEADYQKAYDRKRKEKFRALITGPLLEKFVRDNRIQSTSEEREAFRKNAEEIGASVEREMKERLEKARHDARHAETLQARKEAAKMVTVLEKSAKRPRNTQPEDRTKENELVGQMIVGWKAEKAIYEKYEGPAIYTKFGPYPVGAMESFFRDEVRKGNLAFKDPEWEKTFFEVFDARSSRVPPEEMKERYAKPTFP